MSIKHVLGFVIVLFAIASSQEYKPEEMFTLAWGNENDTQLPYAIDEQGGFWGPILQFVDGNENIYLAYPNKDFRKFNREGDLIYKKELRVLRFAVDDSENVYFMKPDLDQMNVIRELDKNGNELQNSLTFSIDNHSQNISWIKNRNGHIVFGNYRETAMINEGLIL